jgi:hypothetical protein
LDAPLPPLVFDAREHSLLLFALERATPEVLEERSELLCRRLRLRTEPAKAYARAITAQFALWTQDNAAGCSISEVFL